MNIVLITQKDPFYLAENIKYLLQKMPEHSKVVGCIVFDVAPFGRKQSLIDQAKDTYKTFGLKFFMHYSWLYLINKFNPKKDVRRVLEEHKVPLIELDKRINHKSSIKKINEYNPDLLVSIAGNQIFKKPIINLAPKGCLNLHTALLPKYRGLMPSFWVLRNNEKETGVSVFFVDEGIDSGDIVVQKKVTIGNKSQAELIKVTKKMGMEAIVEAINKINLGDYALIPNPEADMTYFSKPTRKDVKAFLANGKRFF